MNGKNKSGNKKAMISYFMIILALFLLSFASRAVTINQPVTDDSILYTELARNMGTEFRYASPVGNEMQNLEFRKELDWEPHTAVPPFFTIAGLPFFWLVGNPMYSIKIASIFWGSILVCLIFIFTERLLKGRKNALLYSTTAALIVLFNPGFFYYTGIIPLTEPLSILLVTLGFYLYLFHSKNTWLYLISGLCFSLALVTRYPAGAFIIAFSIPAGLAILKRKEIWKSIGFLAAGWVPIGLWLLRSYLVFGTFNPVMQGEYARHFGGNISHLLNSGLVTAGAVVLAFQLLLPITAYAVIRFAADRWREEGRKFLENPWLYFFIAAIITVLTPLVFLDKRPFAYMTAATSVARFIIPIMPILAVLSVYELSNACELSSLKFGSGEDWKKRNANRKDKKKAGALIYYKNTRTIANISLAAVLLSLFCVCMITNYGFVKDQTDRIIDLPEYRTQKAYHWQQAISWVNQNAEPSSAVTYYFGDRAFDEVHLFFENYLRKDLSFVEFGMINASESPVLVISGVPEESIGMMAGERDIVRLFSTGYDPKAYVFYSANA